MAMADYNRFASAVSDIVSSRVGTLDPSDYGIGVGMSAMIVTDAAWWLAVMLLRVAGGAGTAAAGGVVTGRRRLTLRSTTVGRRTLKEIKRSVVSLMISCIGLFCEAGAAASVARVAFSGRSLPILATMDAVIRNAKGGDGNS